MAVEELLAEGSAALEAGRWADARAAFERALAIEETGDALDGLGSALWWLGETQASVDHRTRAYAAFRKAGDVTRAFAAATSVAVGHGSHFGNLAAAHGWIARAERLLDDPEQAPFQGWLLSLRGYYAENLGLARQLLERALTCARESGDVDLELVALADLGLKLVTAGDVEQGLGFLDEAMAGTFAGDATTLDTVVYTCCDMLEACEQIGDLERATQWCRVAEDFIRRYGCPFLYARCRTHYGAMLVATGRWAQADEELAAAMRMTEDIGPRPRADVLSRLADLRLRQGRLEDAEALLAGCSDAGSAVLPAAAARLARGECAAAAAMLERHLGHLDERHVQASLALGLLVEAQIAGGDLAAAADTSTRLTGAAARSGRPHAVAHATLASALVRAADGRTHDAVAEFERALTGFAALGLPLETARVRLRLARVVASDRPQVAIAEAGSALAVFERLGAAGDADAAAALLRSLGVRARIGPRGMGTLTKRELEVLRLVGLGLSNSEIAERLFISRKTAAHHVSNLLAKLGVRNRTEAVARTAAVRSGGLGPDHGGRTDSAGPSP